jgi:hypothetical protein
MENLGRNLCYDPANDRVRNRNFVNIAPLQLGKERRLFAHGLL